MNTYRRLFSGAALLVILAVAAVTLNYRQADAQNHQDIVRVRDVDVAARTPFQTTLNTTALTGGPGISSITLPNDRRLTLEFASVSCTNSQPPTSGILVSLKTVAGGTSVSHVLAPKFLLSVGVNASVYGSSEVVRIYADPGTDVALQSAPGDNCFVTSPASFRRSEPRRRFERGAND